MEKNNYAENSFVEKMAKEWEDTKPTINDIYQEMGKYKHAHLKFEQRLGFIQDILDDISMIVEVTHGEEEEARVFENEGRVDSFIYRMNDAIMKLMLSYSDYRNEMTRCHAMWMHRKGELKVISASRDYQQERLDVYKSHN